MCYVTLGLTIKIVSLLMSLTGELLQLFYKKLTDVQSEMARASHCQTAGIRIFYVMYRRLIKYCRCQNEGVVQGGKVCGRRYDLKKAH